MNNCFLLIRPNGTFSATTPNVKASMHGRKVVETIYSGSYAIATVLIEFPIGPH